MPWNSLPNKIPLYQVNLNFYVATQEESIQKFRGLCCLPAVARARLSAVLTKETGSQSLLICFEGLSPQPRPLCVVRRLGRAKKEIVRADDGKGKETRLLAIFRFLLFSLVYLSISFRGGESMRDASLGKAMRAARGLKRTKEQCLVFFFNTMRSCQICTRSE